VLQEELSAADWIHFTMLPIILLGFILAAEALSVEEMLEFGGKRFQELKQSMYK